MNEAWVNIIIGGTIGVLGTLLGTIVNGRINLGNARLQLQHQEIREKKLLFLSKLEETHTAVSDYLLFCAKIGADINNDNGVTSLKPSLDKFFLEGGIKIHKISTLIQFYLQHLVSDGEHLVSTNQEILMSLIKYEGLRNFPDQSLKEEDITALIEKIKASVEVSNKIQAQIVMSSTQLIENIAFKK